MSDPTRSPLLRFGFVLANAVPTMVGVVAIALVAFEMRLSGRVAAERAPQLTAAQSIRAHVATGHLWFEESIAGDGKIDFTRDVLTPIDLAERAASVLATGGDTEEGSVVSLYDPASRVLAEQLAETIRSWRGAAVARRAVATAFAGTDADQAFDEGFHSIVMQADSLVVELRRQLDREVRWVELLQIGTLVAVMLLFGCVVWTVRSSRRRLMERADELSSKVDSQTIELTTRVGELERRNREIGLMSDMSDVMQTCGDGEEALRYLTPYLEALFPAQPGAVFVFRNSRNLLEPIARWGDVRIPPVSFEPDGCWALRRGRTHTAIGNQTLLTCGHVGGSRLHDYLCVPMMAGGETLGILYLERPAADGEDAVHRQLLQTFCEHLGLALSNLRLRERLRDQSIRDALTGLVNRRFLEEFMTRDFSRAERAGRTVSVLMIDVDHFKRFNDTFGHEAGDLVLREVGGVLLGLMRASDVACRYGGEEFTVVLPEMPLEKAIERAEVIRGRVRQIALTHGGQSLGRITISVGVAAYPVHGATVDRVMQAADAALYTAKEAGRDRVVVAPSHESATAPPTVQGGLTVVG